QIEQRKGGRIRPLRILEEEQGRLLARETLEQIKQRREGATPLLGGGERQWRISLAGRGRQQRGGERCHWANARSVPVEQGFQLGETLLGGVVGLEPRRSLEMEDEWTHRTVDVIGRALMTQPYVSLAGKAPGEGGHQAGLANSRLARDQYHLSVAGPGEALALEQEIQFARATDEIAQAGARRLEAVFRCRH